MAKRLPDVLDAASVLAIGGGLGYRFGWWLAAVTVGVLVIVSNWSRSR